MPGWSSTAARVISSDSTSRSAQSCATWPTLTVGTTTVYSAKTSASAPLRQYTSILLGLQLYKHFN
eukprot:m.149248 g.149248  ORF g.149248 m.149248 type:complete len:66 (+) comp14204_c0_seq1:2536-2733(+)